MGDVLKRTLTDRFLKSLKPLESGDPGYRRPIWDAVALGLCVRRLRETIAMEPGDVIMTNHPAFGGSHLPDVTATDRAICVGELIARG